MTTLPSRLKRIVEFDSEAIKTHIDELWPKGDDVEITNAQALELLAHTIKWNHARLSPLIHQLIQCVEALDKTKSIVVEDECEECGTFKGVRYEIKPNVEALTALEDACRKMEADE